MTAGCILDALGNAPLVACATAAPAGGAELWLKLEHCALIRRVQRFTLTNPLGRPPAR